MSTDKRPNAQTQIVKTQLRVPAELHAQLLAAAAKSGRSMNAEIVYRLELAFALEVQNDLQDRLLQIRERRAEKDEGIITMLAERLLTAMTELSQDGGAQATSLGETIERAKAMKAKRQANAPVSGDSD